MDFILIHYKAIIAIISSLTGLLALGITFYSKYRDSNIKDKELELKKEQFVLEKKHQISKEKYQELFEQKINVYKNLYSKIYKFKQQLYEVGKYFDGEDEYGRQTMDELKVEDVNVATLQSIFKEIENNYFVISNELIATYEKIYDLYRKNSAEFDFLMNVGAIDNPKQEWKKIKSGFYSDYKELINSFFEQIENEIKTMKKEIGFI
jgi:hypothetical protein